MLISWAVFAALAATQTPVTQTPVTQTAAMEAPVVMETHVVVETPASNTRDCLSTHTLRSTAVLDDQTILFQLRDGSVWKNTLDFSCPTLGFHESFSYVSHGSRLCDLDSIKVFEPFGISGASCGLGKFERQLGTMRELRTAARAEKRLARAKRP